MNTSQYLPLIIKLESFLKGETDSVNMPEVFSELHAELINQAIIKSGGNNTKAARSLGIQRTNLLYHLGYTPKKRAMISDRPMNVEQNDD